jgi:hypothetical protein
MTQASNIGVLALLVVLSKGVRAARFSADLSGNRPALKRENLSSVRISEGPCPAELRSIVH